MFELNRENRVKIDEIDRKITNGDSLTADEAVLYGEYKAYAAAMDAELKARIDIVRNQSEIEIAEARETERVARESFETLAAAALERYERTLSDG